MNKSDLVDSIAQKADLSKSAATRALDAVTESIISAVSNGEQVSMVGFGVFKPVTQAAREGKNPKTGEKIAIPATVKPKFTAGTAFKASVADKK